MTFTTAKVPVRNTGSKPMLVEKMVETINNQMISKVYAYNYSEHDPEREGEYHSWPLGDGRGNAIFEIPANTNYKFDKWQNMFLSDKIKFIEWIPGTYR